MGPEVWGTVPSNVKENPRRGRQARNFTTNVPEILDLKSTSEQKFYEIWRWVPLLHDGESWKSAQWPNIYKQLIAFRVGHRHVQLTRVDLYIKLQEIKKKENEKKEKAKSYSELRYKSSKESEDERQRSTTCL